MRIVLTSMPVMSHLVPLVVPLAQALARAGHEVTVATGTAMAEELARHGVRHLPLRRALAPDQFGQDPELAKSIGLDANGAPIADAEPMDPGEAFGRLFAGAYAVRSAEDLLEALDGWNPDLVVRECTEFGGYLAGERLGVRQAVLDHVPLVPTRHPGMLGRLNESRAALGLPSVTDVAAALTRHPWYGAMPAQWSPAASPSSAERHYRLPAAPDRDPLDPAIAALPPDRPLILATLGSNTGHMVTGDPVLENVVEALGALPCQGVVALGAHRDPHDWTGPRPGNVHLASFVQQRLLLPACDLFVTHAGANGIREALSAGVPMVAVPLFADQPVNAARLADLGLGLTVRPEDAGTALADACRRALDDPGFRQRARGFQRQMLALPGVDQLIADLTK
ncbi:glycosyltransferase [Streptomyces spinosirectus]